GSRRSFVTLRPFVGRSFAAGLIAYSNSAARVRSSVVRASGYPKHSGFAFSRHYVTPRQHSRLRAACAPLARPAASCRHAAVGVLPTVYRREPYVAPEQPRSPHPLRHRQPLSNCQTPRQGEGESTRFLCEDCLDLAGSPVGHTLIANSRS